MKNAERIDIGHCRIFRDGVFEFADVRLLGGQAEIKDVISGEVFSDTETERYLFPGFTDVHVHLREPGFSYKETVKSGTYAAASAGLQLSFSAVVGIGLVGAPAAKWLTEQTNAVLF